MSGPRTKNYPGRLGDYSKGYANAASLLTIVHEAESGAAYPDFGAEEGLEDGQAGCHRGACSENVIDEQDMSGIRDRNVRSQCKRLVYIGFLRFYP